MQSSPLTIAQDNEQSVDYQRHGVYCFKSQGSSSVPLCRTDCESRMKLLLLLEWYFWRQTGESPGRLSWSSPSQGKSLHVGASAPPIKSIRSLPFLQPPALVGTHVPFFLFFFPPSVLIWTEKRLVAGHCGSVWRASKSSLKEILSWVTEQQGKGFVSLPKSPLNLLSGALTEQCLCKGRPCEATFLKPHLSPQVVMPRGRCGLSLRAKQEFTARLSNTGYISVMSHV